MIFFSDDTLRNPKKELIIFIVVLLTLGTTAWLLQKNKEDLLEDHVEAYGVVADKTSSYLGRELIYIEFSLNEKVLRSRGFEKESCYNKLRVGDSVLIVYSVKSPTVVDIIDCNSVK